MKVKEIVKAAEKKFGGPNTGPYYSIVAGCNFGDNAPFRIGDDHETIEEVIHELARYIHNMWDFGWCGIKNKDGKLYVIPREFL